MKNKWLAAALNMLPGLGYLYLGVRRAFAGLMLLYLPAIITASLLDPATAAGGNSSAGTGWGILAAFFGLPMVAFMVDAYQEAGRVNRERSGPAPAESVRPAAELDHAELDHYATPPHQRNRRLPKRQFAALTYAAGLAVMVSSFVALVAGCMDSSFVASLDLPAGSGSVGILLGQTALGMVMLSLAYAGICWAIDAGLRRRAYITTVGWLDFLPNSQNRLATYVKWALLIAELWAVAYWVRDNVFVNWAMLAIVAGKDIITLVTLMMLTSALSALWAKPATTPQTRSRPA